MWKRTPLLALVLAGCPWIGPDAHSDRLDADGDGFEWPADCGPDDKHVHPGAPEVCNGIDDDCDDGIDEDAVDAPTWYADADGDTWGDPTVTVKDCAAPTAYVDRAGDCDDASVLAHTGLVEVCDDHLDNDCDGTDNGCDATGMFLLAEADFAGVGVDVGDGYGVAMAFGPLDGVAGGDLVIGAPTALVGSANRGAVYVHRGPLPNALDGAAGTKIHGDVDYAQVGRDLTFLGDVDLDGDGDLLVGAPAYTSSAGAVYLVRGPDFVAGSISQGLIGIGATGSRYGTALAALGDVNADGRADFAVAARGSSTVAGAVYLFRGPAPSVSPSAATATIGHATCKPTFLGGVGDVDGDGVPDLLVADPSCEAATPDGGEAWLVSGDVTGAIALEDARARFVADASILLGYAVATTPGDVDGDGKYDIAIGAPAYEPPAGTTDAGLVLLYTGGPTGDRLPADATARIVGGIDSLFGFSVDIGGDLNGDGYDDLVVGAPYHRVGADVTGAVFLYYGPVTGDLTIADADAVFLGPIGSFAGYPVRILGDVDGDGFDDLFVGAPGSSASGAIYGFLGRGR